MIKKIMSNFVGNFLQFLQILQIMLEKDEKYIFGVVKISEKGQIVIPRDARKVYDLKPGDALLLVGDKNGMALLKTEIFQDVVSEIVDSIKK